MAKRRGVSKRRGGGQRAAPVSSAKAKKILKDGTIRGKALTTKQKGFFGRIAGGARSVRV